MALALPDKHEGLWPQAKTWRLGHDHDPNRLVKGLQGDFASPAWERLFLGTGSGGKVVCEKNPTWGPTQIPLWEPTWVHPIVPSALPTYPACPSAYGQPPRSASGSEFLAAVSIGENHPCPLPGAMGASQDPWNIKSTVVVKAVNRCPQRPSLQRGSCKKF